MIIWQLLLESCGLFCDEFQWSCCSWMFRLYNLYTFYIENVASFHIDECIHRKEKRTKKSVKDYG